jgi:hypothetical protein
MPIHDHYSSSTNPHRALMVMLTLLAGGLSFGLYMGWTRYIRLTHEREAWLKSGEEVTKVQLEAARQSINLSATSSATISDVALSNPTPASDTSVAEPPSETAPEAPMVKPAATPAPESGTLGMLADMAKVVTLVDGFAPPEPIFGPVPEENIKRGSELMQQFWHATTWKEKAAFVVDADRVAPLMQQYYEQRKAEDPTVGSMTQSARFKISSKEVLMLVYSSTRPGDRLEAALLPQTDGSLRLDWESYVGWGEMGFSEFKKSRTTTPTMLRVFAHRGQYYNYEFSDEKQFLSVQLFSPDLLTTFHAYCERDSDLGAALDELFSKHVGADPALSVRVAFPEKAQSDHAARLTGIIADRWIMLR